MGKNLICGRRKKICLMSILGFVIFSLLFSGCGGSSSNGDGSETAHSGPYSVDGYIQKGPFISGSTIIIQELDDRFNPTGVTYQTTTNDDFGSFALGNYIQSRYVEIIATGFYFNEVSGALSDAAITLRAIADLSMEDRVNVNLLTTLEKNRIIHLIKNENKSFVDAREQAEKEVLGIFNITGADILSFDQLDLSSENQGDAILLAISAIFQGKNSVAELSELLSKINLDIEKDGILDNSMYAAALKESSASLVFNQIRTNLENRYASLGLTTGIPGFESYARTLVPPKIINTAPKNFTILTSSYKPEISVTFNQEMNEATLTPAAFRLNNGSDNISGVISYNASQRKAFFTPSIGLSGDKTYTVSISTDVKSLSGISLEKDMSWDFSIEIIPPTIIKTSPADFKSLTDSNTPEISVIFSQEMNKATLTPDSFTLNNGPNNISGTVSYDASQRKAIFTPSIGLSGDKTYTVSISADVKALSGKSLQENISWDFSIEIIPPIVTKTTPTDYKSLNDSLTPEISVAFSQEMNEATLTPATFILNNGPNNISGMVSYDASQRKAIFTPSTGLSSDKTYTVLISTDVKSLYGIALRENISWDFYIEKLDQVPIESNKIATGSFTTIGLKTDGTVVAVGDNYWGQCDVSSWTDIVKIFAGHAHTIGLKSDGSIVAVGYNNYGQCDISSWTDIVQISANSNHTVGLKSDGSVVAVGYNDYGQCDVSSWTDIVQVSAGGRHTVGLKPDGSVVAVGYNGEGQCNMSTWNDIVQISASYYNTVGLKSNSSVVLAGEFNYDGNGDLSSWTDIVQISSREGHIVGLKSDGSVVATGYNDDGRCNVISWTDIVQISTGWYYTVGLKSDGSVVAVGDNHYGACDVSSWTGIVP